MGFNARVYKQGKYELRHPEKYVGDANSIYYRSSWELRMHEFLDMNKAIIAWSSEELCIPYMHPITHTIHHYYPDYWCKYVNRNGEVIEEVIEVKPVSQTVMSRSRNKQRRLEENAVTIVNHAKWRYAMEYCETHNMRFRIATENQIFK